MLFTVDKEKKRWCKVSELPDEVSQEDYELSLERFRSRQLKNHVLLDENGVPYSVFHFFRHYWEVRDANASDAARAGND